MSELVKAARLFANSNHYRIEAHRNPAWQSPEVHLKSVAQMISSVSQNDAIVAAAWLHDILEDTDTKLRELEEVFGREVAEYVLALTDFGTTVGNRAFRKALDRDRSYLLNEAVRSYLEVQQWQIEQIDKALEQADAGKLIDHSDVRKMAAKWLRR